MMCALEVTPQTRIAYLLIIARTENQDSPEFSGKNFLSIFCKAAVVLLVIHWWWWWYATIVIDIGQ